MTVKGDKSLVTGRFIYDKESCRLVFHSEQGELPSCMHVIPAVDGGCQVDISKGEPEPNIPALKLYLNPRDDKKGMVMLAVEAQDPLSRWLSALREKLKDAGES